MARRPPVGSAGARSLGDPFYPTLGNGGYDVVHYDLDLTWHLPDIAHRAGWLAGLATIDLRTTQDLSELSFDLTACQHACRACHGGWRGGGSSARMVSDASSSSPRRACCPPTRTSGSRSAGPRPRWVSTSWVRSCHSARRPGRTDIVTESTRVLARGFLSDGAGGWFMASQPNGAHTLFPSNDYPTDKATVTVRLTAPPGMLGVATGSRVQQTANDDGTTTTTWASSHPVATHVLAMGVGRWSVIEDDPAGGPHLRSSVPADLAALAPLRLDVLDDAVGWLRDRDRPAVPVRLARHPDGGARGDGCGPGGADAHPDRRRDARPAAAGLRLAQPRGPRDRPPVVR